MTAHRYHDPMTGPATTACAWVFAAQRAVNMLAVTFEAETIPLTPTPESAERVGA